MICPVCEGRKVMGGWACPGFRYVVVPCHICNGTGEVDDEYPERRARGKAMRAARIARREGMLAAAKRLGVDIGTYSDMEWGRIEPVEEATE